MDREAMEIDDEEVLTELEALMAALRPDASALPSAATRRPWTTTRIRSVRSRRPSRLPRPPPRPYPPPTSAPVGLPPSGLVRLVAALALGLDQDQSPETRRSQEQEPEVEFDMTTMPSIDQILRGVPSSAGGIVPMPRPHTPVRRATASTSARIRPRAVKFRSAHWVWMVLSRLPVDPPLPPSDSNTSE